MYSMVSLNIELTEDIHKNLFQSTLARPGLLRDVVQRTDAGEAGTLRIHMHLLKRLDPDSGIYSLDSIDVLR